MNKEIIEHLIFEIRLGTRSSKIDCIIEYSEEEFETKGDYLTLAKEEVEQINQRLSDLITYYLTNEN